MLTNVRESEQSVRVTERKLLYRREGPHAVCVFGGFGWVSACVGG